jgi:hypothetical protein
MTRLIPLIVAALIVRWASAQAVPQPPAAVEPLEKQPAAAPAKDERASTSAPARTERDIAKILSGRVPEVAFDHTPLEKVVEWVQGYSGVLVYVRYAVLEEQGITRDTPITVKAKDAALEQILWLIMNEAAGARGVTLAYEASADLILFSTHADLSSKLVARAYDFKDIHVDVPYFWREGDGVGWATVAGAEGKNFRARVRRAVPHSSSLGGELLVSREDGASPVLEIKSEDEALQEFMELILNTVEPETWAVNGMGGKGTIFPYKGRLIIRNSLHVHQILSGEENP